MTPSAQHAPPTPTSLESIYRDHRAYVARMLRHFGVTDADVDDAVQEVFLVVSRRLGEFEGRASLRTWLGAIALRVASTRRRGVRREGDKRAHFAVLTDTMPREADDPEAAAARAEAAEILASLLQCLDEDKRRVFVLTQLERLPVVQVARILDLNVRTTHSRLRLARARVRAELARYHARERGLARRAMRGRSDRDRRGGPLLSRIRVLVPLVRRSLARPIALWVQPGWPWLVVLVVAAGIGAALTSVGRSPSRADASPPSTSRPDDGDGTPTPRDETEIASVDAKPPPALAPTERPPATPPAAPRPTPPPVTRLDAPASPRSTPPESPSGDALGGELDLIEAVRSALARGDPERALARADEHARRYPTGRLRLERDSSRVRALCMAGRTAQARAWVDRLTRERPEGPWDLVFAAHCR